MALRDATEDGHDALIEQGTSLALAAPTPRSRLQWALEAYVRSTRALIHFDGFDELVEHVCAAIVENDHYLLAAVGLVAPGDHRPVRIAASAGVAARYFDGLELSASASTPMGLGPTGRALRSGEPYVMADCMADPVFAPWRERGVAFGLRSSVAVPFKLEGELRGVLMVYAGQADVFGEEELSLFGELAEQLAFAMSVSDDRARLADTARDYKLLADHSSDLIIRFALIEDGDRLIYLSPSVARLGYAQETFIGRSTLSLVHPDDRAAAKARTLELASTGSTSADPVTLRIQHADGRWLWFEGSPQLIHDEDGRAEVIISMRDVTERLTLERELRRRQGEAEAGGRAKSEFLANMSHEIRTPLTAVVGFADLLRESAALPSLERGYANRIAVAGQSLQTMVDQILDFSNVDAGRVDLDPQPFDPAGLANSVIDMLADVAREKQLDLHLGALDHLPHAVVADAGRVRQVLLNIVGNALKFTERGGVTVSASHDAEAGGTLRFAVTDTGIGIPPELGEALFERFSQVDGSVTRRHGGAGLGLAISRSLVERMGGQIGYSGQVGDGSTFWFSVAAPAAIATPEPSNAPSPAAGRPKVLIVDDAPVNCELVGAMLEAADYEVAFAYDGAQAVDAAAAAPFDLILMDMQMPVMDGPSAARAIRGGQGPNAGTPIVAVSANVLPMHVQACLDAGMDDHIPKPIATHTLMTKVSHWAGRERAAR